MRNERLVLFAIVGLCAVAFAVPAINPPALPDAALPLALAVNSRPVAPRNAPVPASATTGDAANRPFMPQKAGGRDGIWDPEKQVTSGSYYYLNYSGKHCVTDSRGWIHVVSWDGSDVFYKRYRPGIGWSSDTVLYGATYSSDYPAIALDSNGTRVHVVFQSHYDNGNYSSYDVLYLKCDPTATGNGGWDANPSRLSTDKSDSNAHSYYPTIACSPGGQVHVCWWDDNTSNNCNAVSYIEYRSGAWQKIVHVDSSGASNYDKNYPSIAAGRNHNLAICWYGYDDGGGTSYTHIYCARRVSGTWQATEQPDGYGGFNYNQYNCDCAISPKDNSVHVVWHGYWSDGYPRIQTSWYSYDSLKWMNVTVITPEDYPVGVYQYNPNVCATPDGRVGIVWYGYNSNYDYQIKYAERSPGGAWSAQVPIGGSSTTYEYYPSVTSDSAGGLCTVWDDERNGFLDIYLRHRAPLFNDDIYCTGILKPGVPVRAGAPVTPTIIIRNAGVQKQSNIPYCFWVDSAGARVYTGSGTYSGTLLPDSSAQCSMTTQWTPSSALWVDYNLTGFCNLSGDQYRQNDTQYLTDTTCSFILDFETDNGGLIADPDTCWQWGVPGSDRPPAHSGRKVWGDALTGFRQAPFWDSLIANDMIATTDSPKVAWYAWYYTYPYYPFAGWNLRYSTDGRKTWTLCHSWPGHSPGYNGFDSLYYGESVTWEHFIHIVPVKSGTSFALGWVMDDVYYGGCPGVMIDDVAGFGFRFPFDVGVAAIHAPTGTVDSNTTITPAVQVTNYGRSAETFYAKMRIYNSSGTVYVDSEQTMLKGDTTGSLVFKPVTLLKRGTWTVKCSTMLANDDVHGNDAMQETLNVRVKDVGVRTIVAPPDTVVMNIPFVPRAVYRNYGTDEEIFNCHLQIDSTVFYKTKRADLLPGAETSMVFLKDSLPEGSHLMKAFTDLKTDANWHNDTITQSVFCSRHDVGATAIVSPIGILPLTPPIPCSVLVTNHGRFNEHFYVKFTILDSNDAQVYADSLVMNVTPVETMTVAMPQLWSPPAYGKYTSKAWTMLATDQVHSNDTAKNKFLVNVIFGPRDVAVVKINSPVGVIDTITTQPVAATVANYSSQPVSFESYFTITGPTDAPTYYDSFAVVDLGSHKTRLVTFKPWAGKRDTGLYTAMCSVYVAGDTYHNPDDVRYAEVHVVRDTRTGWITTLPYMPPGPRSKPVNDGGALACNVEGGVAYVYGFKGNNLTEFYRYTPSTNLWATAESIPWVGRSGKKKGIKTGGAIASLNSKMYAVKGNSCNDFFVYNPNSPSDASHWANMPSVPGVAIKNGCGLGCIPPSGVGADTLGFVYLLKGSNSYEFWRYDLVKAIWEQMPNAPSGPTGRPWKTGSCLASDGMNIYALKAGYNEFYRFVVSGDSWIALNPLPFIGQTGHKKVVGDGGALACLNGNIFALKGNNTSEFWEFANGSWMEWPDMPAGTGKYGKGGCSLAASPEQLYALKGNNTLEFYGYVPTFAPVASTTPTSTHPTNVQDAKVTADAGHLSIAPNPFNGTTHISYSLPRAGNVSIRLYDVSGSPVATILEGSQTVGSHVIPIRYSDLGVSHSRLARGIYILKLSSDGYNTTAKLIIE